MKPSRRRIHHILKKKGITPGKGSSAGADPFSSSKALQIQEAKDQLEEEHGLEVTVEELSEAIKAATHARLRANGDLELKEAVVDAYLGAHGE